MITQKDFSIAGSDGKIIYGDITFNETNNTGPLVLFVHGFKGFKDWGAHNLVARHFAQNGYRYAKFNFTYSGVTPEQPNDVSDLEAFASNTFSKELFDLDIVIDFLTSNFTSDGKISLIGHSRGGGISIVTASINPKVYAVITWSAVSKFNGIWKKEQEDEWRKTGKTYVTNARTKEQMPLNITLLEDLENNQERLDIVASAKQINIPWLIIHGDDDVNVPFEEAELLANAQPNSRLVKIEGANHVYGASHPYEKDTLPLQLFQVAEKSLKFLGEVRKIN